METGFWENIVKQTDPQLKLRLPPRLMEQIRKSAEDNRKTLSAEIIARLEWTFARATQTVPVSEPASDLELRVAALEQDVKASFAPVDYLQQELTDVLERIGALEKAASRK